METIKKGNYPRRNDMKNRRSTDIALLEMANIILIGLFSFGGWEFIREMFFLNGSVLKILAIVFSVGNLTMDIFLIYVVVDDFYTIALNIRDCIKIMRKK